MRGGKLTKVRSMTSNGATRKSEIIEAETSFSMAGIDVVRSLLLTTAADAFAGRPVSKDLRSMYNELLRLGQHPVPTVVRCSRHPSGANMLYGIDDQPEGTIVRLPDGRFACRFCAENTTIQVLPLTSI